MLCFYNSYQSTNETVSTNETLKSHQANFSEISNKKKGRTTNQLLPFYTKKSYVRQN